MTPMLPIVNIFQESDKWDQDRAEDVVAKVTEQLPQSLNRDFTGFLVNFVLADNAFIQPYNQVYRDIDRPTNVLSFPYCPEDTEPEDEFIILGDVILAYETIEKEALEQGKPFWDHFAHLITHGFLHLLGYDHMDEAEAKEMETLEVSVLKALKIPDPYQEDVG